VILATQGLSRLGIAAAMAEFNVDVTRLPEDVREKLAELELELSEGECQFFDNFFLISLLGLLYP
jgi:hypothetical protein